jgi:hypothetical protein
VLDGQMLENEGTAARSGQGRMSRYSAISQSVTVPMKRSHSSRL